MKSMKPISIETRGGIRHIGPGYPSFIVAELSGNHSQSYKTACKIIDAIADTGADAVKLQTYTADTMTIDSDKKYFKLTGSKLWKGETLYGLYKKASTPWDWHPRLKSYAEKRGLVFFSTPFDNTAVDFLKKMNVPLYKVASYELTDTPLLQKIASTKKPVILSRGMASIKEIGLAINTLRKYGTRQIAVLHCISSYPTDPKDMNLRTIPDIMSRFRVISGLSDHSITNNAAIASIALGASIIEKHITLNRHDKGVDSKFSLEPHEFKDLVKAVRETENALGKIHYATTLSEINDKLYRRSLFITKSIRKGEKFTKNNTRIIRPGYGLAPRYFSMVIGKKAKKNIERGTPLTRRLILSK